MNALWLLLFSTLFSSTPIDTTTFPTESASGKALKGVLSGKEEHIESKVRRLGQRTIEVECFLSVAGDLDLFRKIAADYPTWRNWVLQDFNTPRPGEGDYLVQLHELTEESPKILKAVYSFNLPFFSKHRTRSLRMTSKDTKKSFTVEGETVLSEQSPVKTARAYLRGMRGEKPSLLWLQVKAVIQFKNWFLYEALPEKVLLREVRDRLEFIVASYQKEEAQRRQGRKTASGPSVAPANGAEYD